MFFFLTCLTTFDVSNCVFYHIFVSVCVFCMFLPFFSIVCTCSTFQYVVRCVKIYCNIDSNNNKYAVAYMF